MSDEASPFGPSAPDGEDPGPGVAVGIKIDDTIPECRIMVEAHTIDSDPASPLFVIIRSVGRSDAAVRARSQQMFDWMTAGRKTFLRVALEVVERADFETETRSWRGYMRFSVYNEPGEHKIADSLRGMMGMGTDA